MNVETSFVKGELLALILDSPIADIILGNVMHKLEKIDRAGKMADCVAVQTRSQVRQDCEVTQNKKISSELDFEIGNTYNLVKFQEADPSLIE